MLNLSKINHQAQAWVRGLLEQQSVVYSVLALEELLVL
jgi:hypothetical protein